MRTHWVQAAVQGSIFLYWATALPFIAGQFPLIAAQACFAHACTMLLGWTRRGQAELGFGPLPIIQGKEFLRWQRDGRSTHIFNPSVLGLSLFSLALLLSGRTDISWAQQIAVELGRPDHIYLWIFGVGLIVQFMFQVTLVTWAAAATLWLLGMAYTQWTGIHWFLDAGIRIAVFLGLHLLVTDPATSPRSNGGRALFGVAYGAGVFLLYGLLGLLGAPRFYDKLLMVPLLNLAVPWIDRCSRGTALARMWPFARLGAMSGQRQNLIYMALWIASFGAMYATHAVGPGHPGRDAGFWQAACEAGRRNACRNLLEIAEHECVAGQVAACRRIGLLRPCVSTWPAHCAGRRAAATSPRCTVTALVSIGTRPGRSSSTSVPAPSATAAPECAWRPGSARAARSRQRRHARPNCRRGVAGWAHQAPAPRDPRARIAGATAPSHRRHRRRWPQVRRRPPAAPRTSAAPGRQDRRRRPDHG